MSQSRQLAAIMFTDIVGYTAMMQADEKKTVAVVKHYNTTLEKFVSEYNGQILNYYGDGSLCIFSNATDAAYCALAVQKDLKNEPVVPLRIGLHIGEVFFEESKALGDAVNVASRVQSLGQENTILVSGEFQDKIKNNNLFTTISLGQFYFKNILKPLEVFAFTNEGLSIPRRSKMEGKLKKKNFQKRNVVISLSLVLIVAAVFFIYKNLTAKKDKTGIDRSIAVLPFADMSAAKDQEYFSDGLSEELLNLLAKIPELKVIGRTSSFSFKGKNEDLRSIAQQLGVAHILEGSVRKDGNKIRVTAQLIRANDGTHLWSDTYDRDLAGVFQLQDEIANAVVQQLKLKLLATPTNAIDNPEVLNLILQGNYFHDKLDKENVIKSLELYLKALALDSTNARTWALVSRGYSRAAWQNYIDQKEGYAKAKAAAENAVSLDPNSPDALNAIGGKKMYYDFDWAGAKEAFEKVLLIEPANAAALNNLGSLFQILGHWDTAVQKLEKALILDPLKPIVYSNQGANYTYANRFKEANEAYNKALEINPQFQRAHMYIGRNLLLQGKAAAGLAEMQKENDDFYKQFGLALAYHSIGDKNKADQMLNDFVNLHKNDWPYLVAELYAYRGEKEKALEWLEQAYRQNDSWLIWIKGDPLLKNIWDEPRFVDILRKMNLEGN